MNFRHRKLLHYVLIIFMMFAPLRSVFAMQLMVCDMAAESASVTAAAPSAEHCQHVVGQALLDAGQSTLHADQKTNLQLDQSVKSCCSDNGSCMSDCHFALTVSMFVQQTEFSPVVFNTDVTENISNSLIVRELIPPSKPPQSL